LDGTILKLIVLLGFFFYYEVSTLHFSSVEKITQKL